MTTTQKLKEQVERLPEPLAQEVLDFLLFVAGRHRKASEISSQNSLRGSLANWADVKKAEREATAWGTSSLEKHASD